MRFYSKDVSMYLYKCLLRRQRALQALRPISLDSKEQEAFDMATQDISDSLTSEEISEAEKQMTITNLSHIDTYIDASLQYNDDPGTPNRVAVAFVMYENGKEICKQSEYMGSSIAIEIDNERIDLDITVNIAEYLALIKVLKFIVDNEFKGSVSIYSDSLLIVNQVNFVSATRAPKLIVLRDCARKLIDKIESVEVIYISRASNKEADSLAREAITLEEK